MSKVCNEYAVAYEAVAESYERLLQEYQNEYDECDCNWSAWRVEDDENGGRSGDREGFLRDCMGCYTEHAEVKEKAMAVVRSWAYVAIGRNLPGEIERMIDEAIPCRRAPGAVELTRYEWAWHGMWSGPGLYWLCRLDSQGAYGSTHRGEFSTPACGRWADGSTIEVVKYLNPGGLPRKAVDVLHREERGRLGRSAVTEEVRRTDR